MRALILLTLTACASAPPAWTRGEHAEAGAITAVGSASGLPARFAASGAENAARARIAPSISAWAADVLALEGDDDPLTKWRGHLESSALHGARVVDRYADGELTYALLAIDEPWLDAVIDRTELPGKARERMRERSRAHIRAR